MDRLHKLLQIRPTNSDIQQIIVNMHNIESKTQLQLGEVQSNVLSSLRDNLSQEMIGLVDELKTGSHKNDENHRVVRKQLTDYASDLVELRNQVANQLDRVAGDFLLVNNRIQQTQDSITVNKQETERNIQQIQYSLQQQQEEALAIGKKQNDDKKHLHDALRASEQQMQSDLQQFVARFIDTTNTLNHIKTTILGTETGLTSLQETYSNDMKKIQDQFQQLESSFSDERLQSQQMKTMVEEFHAMDAASKFILHEDYMNKIALEVKDTNKMIQTTIAGEVELLNRKISILQETCDDQLPGLIVEANNKIMQLFSLSDHHASGIDLMKERVQSSEELIEQLFPLREQVKIISNKQSKYI
jgi:hypothetical protein